MQFNQQTKSEVLEAILGIVKTATILPQFRFTRSEWEESQLSVVARFQTADWAMKPLIVRSSARTEDTLESCSAGKFTSVLDVQGEEALLDAIETVIESFKENRPDDQVFIQPMVQNVRLNGVAFTRDPNTGSPYYVINYEENSCTDSVTSGRSKSARTYYAFQDSRTNIEPEMRPVVQLMEELLSIFENQDLDIEFAIDESETLYLFQVRPLSISMAAPNHGILRENLELIQYKVQQGFQKHPTLLGERPVFGNMPDWNPAEIIGVRPRPLALSLYRELVTDSIWSYQRSNYGYRNLRSFPLLHSFGGMPYVDARVSFNSFVPASVSSNLAEKLVNHYIKRLCEQPAFHDKVEFQIVFSCYTFDLEERLQSLLRRGFSESEVRQLKSSLQLLTRDILDPNRNLIQSEMNRIETLERRREALQDTPIDSFQKIFWLIEDCKRYGTIPFAGLARVGFIAVQLLESIENVGIISAEERQAFIRDLRTVSSQMVSDFEKLSRTEFLACYGHLRPGTYDILSPRYDEAPERYFDFSQKQRAESSPREPYRITIPQLEALTDQIKKHDLQTDVLSLWSFIRNAIEGREWSKFIFSKNLSDAIRLIGRVAEEYGFSREDASFLNIRTIKDLAFETKDVRETLCRTIEAGRRDFEVTSRLNLPSLISCAEDVFAFHTLDSEPNFITQGKTSGPVKPANSEMPDGSIVFIENADPGFDWIFSKPIAGFITKYGGCNSHMAIRAGELNIPAVIGAGETAYNRWVEANSLELDCMKRLVTVIK